MKPYSVHLEDILTKFLVGFSSGFFSAFLIGGILFFADAFPRIVEKFWAKNEFVAFSIHMLAGIIMATIFSFLFYRKITSYTMSVVYASIFSLVFWLFATVIVKPLKFGGTFQEALLTVFQNLNIFFWHILFGILLGFAFYYLKGIIRLKK